MDPPSRGVDDVDIGAVNDRCPTCGFDAREPLFVIRTVVGSRDAMVVGLGCGVRLELVGLETDDGGRDDRADPGEGVVLFDAFIDQPTPSRRVLCLQYDRRNVRE